MNNLSNNKKLCSAFLIFSLPMSVSSFAQNCEVDGISDSPQHMRCYFSDGLHLQRMTLSCHENAYRIKWKDKFHHIDFAYHEEVESGSTPLVFIGNNFQLKTVSYRIYSSAEFTFLNNRLQGLCFSK